MSKVTNPFAELELHPKSKYRVKFTCWRCNKTDVIMGYKPDEIATLSNDPPPVAVCTCKMETLLEKVT
jgi:hypothetical protein